GRDAHIRVTLKEPKEDILADVFAPENIVMEELQELGIDISDTVQQEQDPKEFLAEFLEDLLQKMYLDASVEVRDGVDGIEVTVDGEDMSLLIGRRGRTLDALQYITNLVFNRNREEYIHVLVDSQNYRAKRKESLEQMAYRMAEKAKRQRKDIILNPMNAYERRIVHSALQKDPHVSTRSEGKDPHRKIIIFLNR
ncbi:MAG: KH domain-containing protein, partial [Tissierellia bacterium]|nr:KH domain-containing protein [Tissierellia bacterium]